MLKKERQALIMNMVERQKFVKVMDLKDLFHVSDETIRRDLADLEKTGQLHCVHGGAVYDTSSVNEYHVNLRAQQNQEEKKSICQFAVNLIENGASIAIGGSTTCQYLKEPIMNKSNLTVITNSLILADSISLNKTNRVILTGGDIWGDDRKTMGTITERTFRSHNVDLAFISVAGISAEKGITEFKEQEAAVTQAIIYSAKRVILLSDHTKFNFEAFRKVADLSEIDDIVTDHETPTEELRKYEELGIRVHKGRR